jgi:hypothetical protein
MPKNFGYSGVLQLDNVLNVIDCMTD